MPSTIKEIPDQRLWRRCPPCIDRLLCYPVRCMSINQGAMVPALMAPAADASCKNPKLPGMDALQMLVTRPKQTRKIVDAGRDDPHVQSMSPPNRLLSEQGLVTMVAFWPDIPPRPGVLAKLQAITCAEALVMTCFAGAYARQFWRHSREAAPDAQLYLRTSLHSGPGSALRSIGYLCFLRHVFTV